MTRLEEELLVHVSEHYSTWIHQGEQEDWTSLVLQQSFF